MLGFGAISELPIGALPVVSGGGSNGTAIPSAVTGTGAINTVTASGSATAGLVPWAPIQPMAVLSMEQQHHLPCLALGLYLRLPVVVLRRPHRPSLGPET